MNPAPPAIPEPQAGVPTRLPRRVGFWVRHRARLGMLPGHVSTAALLQARQLRWYLWYLIVIVAFMAFIAFGVFNNDTSEGRGTVAAVIEPGEAGSELSVFHVVLGDGRSMFFERDPGVEEGQVVLVRARGEEVLLGLTVDGRYVASTEDQDGGAASFTVLMGLLAAATLLALGPAAVWGRRTYRSIRSDLRSAVEQTAGTYLGSWTWRTMAGAANLWRVSQSLGHLAGFPIAIEVEPGEIRWFGAPVTGLAEVRHFETAIANGDRGVTVVYHPATKAIVRLASVDGSEALEFAHPLDDLHPEVGLALKVSHRRRSAHLPDR